MRADLEAYLARVALLASRLRLGEWIAGAFGTEILESRRESERRLPKSAPPPRSSLLRTKNAPAITLPPPPRLPSFAPPPAESLTGASIDVPPSSRRLTQRRTLELALILVAVVAIIALAVVLVR
jgi:hypothetical protein